MMLLRSIGNALPPRHEAEQAYQNLKFTLEHEADFPNVEKHWVLNRIVDSDVLKNLTDLLDSHSMNYTVIPFNLTRYGELEYQFNYYQPVPDPIHDMTYVQGTMKDYAQVAEAIQQDKNLYLTNQNEARNKMIEIGQSTAGIDWVLPWDGNCFLHHNAYEEINRKLQMMCSMDEKYAYTPMNRAMSNVELLDEDYYPDPVEEPQVILHRTAKGRFHPDLRYGRRNKVEFLQRLGVKGPWDKWTSLLDWEWKHFGPFFQPIHDLINYGEVEPVGWTTRLFSGKEEYEAEGTIDARGHSRREGMELLLGRLDTKAAIELHGYRPGQLTFYHEDALTRDRQLYNDGDTRIKSVIDELLELAEKALTAGPFSVMDKPDDSVAISGDKHDYYHLSPFMWPQRPELSNDPKHKWVRRDGQRYPGTLLHGHQCERFDRTRLKDMQYNTTVLGLAYFMTGKKEYGEIGARNIRTWFLDSETRMNPHMIYAQVKKGHNNNTGASFGIIEMKDLYFMLDAVRLIARDGFLSEQEQSDLRIWFSKYLEWLETSEVGKKEYCAKNNHGIYFDVQATAIASFINDTAKMIWYIERSKSRLLNHISQDGSMPLELRRPNCEHYQMFTLQAYATLARIASTVKIRLWNTEEMEGLSLICRAAKYSVPFYGRKSACRFNQNENVERWWPLLLETNFHCPDFQESWPSWFPVDARTPPTITYDMPRLYDPHDGIAPFWNLGLWYGNITRPTLQKSPRIQPAWLHKFSS
jgi:Alginate lyase